MIENENTTAPASLSHAKSHELAIAIIKILDAKKAHNIRLLHVESKTIITDYFIICSGTSRTQIKALADEVDAKIEEAGAPALHKEGQNEGTWILLDFASVIVHIFNSETRRFYNLEKLWNDAEEINISQYLTPGGNAETPNTEEDTAEDADLENTEFEDYILKDEDEIDDDDLLEDRFDGDLDETLYTEDEFDDDDLDYGDDDDIDDIENEEAEL